MMIKSGSDMQQALESLRLKRRYRTINHVKLALMLERAELNVPASWLESHVTLPVLTRLNRGGGGVSRKAALRALVPVAAVAAVLLFFITGLFDFIRGGNSGSAGIVTGEVVITSGGKGTVLRAGDSVGRGDIIVTGSNSTADMHFGNLLNMRVISGSRVTIRKVALGGGSRAFDLLVNRGGCVLDVGRLGAGESVSVRTPLSVGVVRGTRFGVMVGADGAVRYEVFRGTVRVRRSLPEDSRMNPESVKIIERHFTDRAIDLSSGQACVIGTDAIPLQSFSGAQAREAIASLALPVPARGRSVLRDDIESLVRSSRGHGVKSGPGPVRDLLTRREDSRGHGGARLLYIPVLDSVIRIGDRYLTAIRSGDILWSVPLDGPVSSTPAYEATSLYIPTARGAIIKVDLFTGATQWKAVIPGSMSAGVTLNLDASGIYCATSRGNLCKYDRSGEMLWSVATGESIIARPVLSDHIVFVSTVKGSLFGFDSSSGSRTVTVSVGGSIVSISARKSIIFIATSAGRLYCYDYSADEMRWEYQVNDALACDMAVNGNSVYLFGRSGRIYRISGDGSLVWERNLGISLLKRPSEDASSFYIPASESLFVVDKTTGDVTWSLLLPNITSSNVAVSKGHIYFDTGKKRLSSLKK